MTPEQSVQAHLDVEGSIMVPIHNETFDLAFHSWFDPLERVHAAAEEAGVLLRTPQVGELISVGKMPGANAWWRELMPQKA